MAGYTKLFSTILASTIWREPANVRVVWITMLAMSDSEGRVDGSIPGLADLSRVTVEQCQEALKCLSEPDFFSRTKENEGRRIKEIDGGWVILNYLKYREATPADLRREQNREAQKRWRDKRKLTVSKVSERKAPSAQAEALGIEHRAEASEPLAAPKAPRARNELSDALARACGLDPMQMPARAAQSCAVAAASIRRVNFDVDEAEFRRRGENYGAMWPNITLTPRALCDHWADCQNPPRPKDTTVPWQRPATTAEEYAKGF